MLINKDFFNGDTAIPNLNEKCDNLYFYEWIEQWESQCLRFTLGESVYSELVEQLEFVDGEYVLKAGADPKWSKLLYGHSYDRADITNETFPYYDFYSYGYIETDSYRWQGIVKILERRIPDTQINGQTASAIKVKKSYLAYYIYWQWSILTESFTSSTGEQVAKVKGGDRVSNYRKRTEAHNNFVSWVNECNNQGKVGLYMYMQHFFDLFPQWRGQHLCYEPIW